MKNIKTFLLLHFALLIYSASTVASKYAANEPVLSFGFIFYMGLLVLCLGVYAILWQQVLKNMDLTIAYANKGVTVLWGLLLSIFLFKDTITITNVIGCVLVVVGVVLMATGESNNE